MLNWIASVLQFVITWSQTLGILATPFALIILLLAFVMKGRALTEIKMLDLVLWQTRSTDASRGIAGGRI